jgi:hypothetical protein
MGNIGGWAFNELQMNSPLPSWAWRFVGGLPLGIHLLGTRGLKWTRFEVHCMGQNSDQAVFLANAIDNVLDGFSGYLPDANGSFPGTLVDLIVPLNSPLDFFDPPPRSMRRVLEYKVTFNPLV